MTAASRPAARREAEGAEPAPVEIDRNVPTAKPARSSDELGGALPRGGDFASAEEVEGWVLVLRPGAVMVPGGRDAMIAAARQEPALAAIAGVWVPLRPDGSMDREIVRERALRHSARMRRFDYPSYFAACGCRDVGSVLLRRPPVREAVRRASGADDFELALAALDPATVRVLEDPTCAGLAAHGDAPAGARARARNVRVALVRVRNELRRRRRPPATSLRLAFSAVTIALGVEGSRQRLREMREHASERFAWRTIIPLAERAYGVALRRFGRWPIGLEATWIGRFLPSRAVTTLGSRRIAYYLWRYPVLSETFVQREILGLREAGIAVTVVADAPGAGSSHHEDLRSLVATTCYVHPIARADLMRAAAWWLFRRPLRTLNLLAYTAFRPYVEPKSAAQDMRVFLKALYVASMLRSHGIDHVHAPWGDVNAFVAMVAARLVGADFSLQFRAHDLHRRTAAFLIGEKVRNARFVVTNTDFNLRRLHELARPDDHAKIRRIYNGLPLDRLVASAPQRHARSGRLRLLTVARLIEPKGLPYLFEACRTLADRGHDFHCTVIGGPELPLYVNDLVEIRRAHRRLRLEDVVSLEGAQPFSRVVEAYGDADIFVLPCVVGGDASHDITPNALLEAMAMGIPVVATTITAIPELVESGRSGILVPPNDAAALAGAIECLMLDRGLRERMGAEGREHVQERFNVDRNIHDYVELFRRA
jgi:glycosyltransferase involved in cell wall biosynthesis